MNPRNILLIHQAFPGQFGALAQSLARDGHKVVAMAMNPQGNVPGVTILRYLPIRQQDENLNALDQEIDTKLIRAQSIYEGFKALKAKGYNPDVIYAHPGWGEAIFARNVWPEARLVVYAEWYYNLHGQEVNFDPALPPLSEEKELRLSMKNYPFLKALSDCDAAISPTQWQKSRFPAWAQDKISVIHDGLNLEELASIRPRGLGIPSQGLKLRKGMPIVTFSARHLEPVRGFHYFMRALPLVLASDPEAHVIVMGRDGGAKGNGYGAENPEGESWRKTLEEQLGDSVDWKRVHFLGMVDRKIYLALLKLSACHVYLTTPFILSWSFLEAAALGLPIVASDTAPVREFAALENVELVPFDDSQAIAAAVINRLQNRDFDFSQANVDMLRPLDFRNTIPAIKDVLLNETRAWDRGQVLEDIIFIEEE